MKDWEQWRVVRRRRDASVMLRPDKGVLRPCSWIDPGKKKGVKVA